MHKLSFRDSLGVEDAATAYSVLPFLAEIPKTVVSELPGKLRSVYAKVNCLASSGVLRHWVLIWAVLLPLVPEPLQYKWISST